MGLAVINNSVTYTADLPIFGNINFKKDLLFAFRPSANALFDLSDYQNTVSVAGELTGKGVKGYGETATTTSFKDPNTDDLTIIVCGKATDLTTNPLNRAWLASSYNTTSGVGLLITADTVSGSSDKFDIRLRSYFTYQNASSAFAVTTPPDIIIANNAKVTETDYLYAVLRIKADAKLVVMSILNKSLTTSKILTASDKLTAAGRNTINGKTWKIGASDAGPTANTPVEVQELLVYGRYLTDAEVMQQYEADKKWLSSARGILL